MGIDRPGLDPNDACRTFTYYQRDLRPAAFVTSIQMSLWQVNGVVVLPGSAVLICVVLLRARQLLICRPG